MKIKFRLFDYDTNKIVLCDKKSTLLKSLNNLISAKKKELEENKYCVVACDSDVSGKITIRLITKRGE